MTAARVGDNVTVTSLDGVNSRVYMIDRIIGAHISPVDDPQQTSAIDLDTRDDQWKVRGAENNFQVEVDSLASPDVTLGVTSPPEITTGPFNRSEIAILKLDQFGAATEKNLEIVFPNVDDAVSYLIMKMREAKHLNDNNRQPDESEPDDSRILIKFLKGFLDTYRPADEFAEFIEHLQTIPSYQIEEHLHYDRGQIVIEHVAMLSPQSATKSARKR